MCHLPKPPLSPLLKTPEGLRCCLHDGDQNEVGQETVEGRASGQTVIFLTFLDPVSLVTAPTFFPSPLAPSASCLGVCLPYPASGWHLSHPLPSSPDLDTGMEGLWKFSPRASIFGNKINSKEEEGLSSAPSPPRHVCSRSSIW